MSVTNDYWDECVRIGFEENGIHVTDEQIVGMIECIVGSYECMDQAFGHDCIGNPMEDEVKDLKKRLSEEQKKVHCDPCNGRGSITLNDGVRSSTSQCWKCRGEGRHLL